MAKSVAYYFHERISGVRFPSRITNCSARVDRYRSRTSFYPKEMGAPCRQFYFRKGAGDTGVRYFRIFRRRRLDTKRKKFLEHKEQARAIVQQRIMHFNAFYSFSIGAIRIKNQKSRWGSCSKKRNLNFNYRIALLPERLIDYIVVHELCHLGEFNHSQNFWNLVAQTIPDFAERCAELKKIHVR